MKKIHKLLFWAIAFGISPALSFGQGNVGIGTATPDPSAKLDVVDANKGFLFPRVSLTATNVAAPVASPANWLVVFNVATAGAGATAVSPGLYYWDNATLQWIRFNTGAASSAAWNLTGNAGTAPATNFIGTTDARDLVIRTNNIEQMRMTSSGNLGIGIAAPTNPLHVYADASYPVVVQLQRNSGLNVGIQYTNTNNSIYAGMTPNEHFGIALTPNLGSSPLFTVERTGNAGIGTAAPSQKLHVADGSLLTDHAHAAATANVAANTAAFTTGVNPVTQLRITTNASALPNGNLTYGATAIEGQYLWITNTDAQAVPFTSTTPTTNIAAGATMGFVYTGATWRAVSANSAAATTGWDLLGNAGTNATTNFIGTTDAQDFVLRANNTERMRLLAGSGVQITSTNFNAAALTPALDVQGAWIRLGDALGNQGFTNGMGIKFHDSGVNHASMQYTASTQLLNFGRSGTNGNSLNLDVPTSPTVSMDLANLRLGVGTNAPAEAAHIIGNIRSSTLAGVGVRLVGSDVNGTLNNIAAGANGQVLTMVAGAPAWAAAAVAADWSLTGNAGTVDGTNFIGTTDNIPFNIRVNNLAAGRIGATSGQGTFYGYRAGLVSASATGNTAVGFNAMAATTGNNNTALGDNTLAANTTGTQNTAIGANALDANTTGGSNVAIGYNSLTASTTAGNNVAIGNQTMTATATGTDNVAIGFQAALNNNANGNVAIGSQALRANTSGTPNLAIGQNALFANTSGANNIAIGANALDVNTTGTPNLAIGADALGANITGANNIAIGHNALLLNTASNNLAVGTRALDANTSGGSNSAVGVDALGGNTTGISNVALGLNALSTNSTGNANTSVGTNALQFSTNASDNTAVGGATLQATTTGVNNSAIGRSAIGANTTGNSNSALGYNAGLVNTIGSNNTYLGATADASVNNLSNATAIGSGATVDASNKVRIGNNSVTATDVAGQLRVNANAIGTNDFTLPVTRGTVGQVLTTDGAGATSWAAAAGSGWGLTGNAGTVSGTNFIGTTDNVPFNFRVNNTAAGRIGVTSAQGTFYGYRAGATSGAATGNTAIGFQAMAATTGTNNTAVGDNAMAANTTGANNVAVGTNALDANTTGARNTAVGNATLGANTASDNVAVGDAALAVNTSGINNVAVGSSALSSNTTASNLVAVGESALGFNTTGASNTAVGGSAMLANTTGGSNVAVGTEALTNNTTGGQNIAIGHQALQNNNTGVRNIGIGFRANANLIGNTTTDNIAIGYMAGASTTAGVNNISIGTDALGSNSTGLETVAIGRGTLYRATTGGYNTGVGTTALDQVTTGAENVALGVRSGNVVTTGRQNVLLGIDANVSTGALNNTVALGTSAVVNASNKVRIGSGITNYEVGVAWTVVSDRNLKKNIEANTLGLDFIRQLRPVTYEYKAHEKAYRYTGLIAQEVEETLAKMRKESSILASPSKGDGSYGIRYAELTIPLIQSVQEQQTQIETLQKENAELKARLERIEKMLSDKK